MGLVNDLQKSKEVIYNLPVITVLGKNEVHIENILSIVEYESCIIRVKVYKSTVSITGKDLVIVNYNQEEIHIKGIIECINP